MINQILQGDCLQVLKTLEDNSIDCVVTSPPYWNLRDYGVDGQLGLEPTFYDYINKLCDVFDEVKRVLKPTGTCWVNLGDTYHNATKWTNKDECPQTISGGNNRDFVTGKKQQQGLPEKCLCQIPSRFSIEMIKRGWILRNEIIWYKRNCMPASVKDRFTVDFEKIFFFVKQKQYYFEQQFEGLSDIYLKDKRPFNVLRQKLYPNSKYQSNDYGNNQVKGDKKYEGKFDGDVNAEMYGSPRARTQRDGGGQDVDKPSVMGRNMRCVWDITTRSFKEAHFAVFPPELPARCIKAGSPGFICPKCGEPRKRIVKNHTTYESFWGKNGLTAGDVKHVGKYGKDNVPSQTDRKREKHDIRLGPTSNLMFQGYTDCGCGQDFQGGIVLDPFAGSGTTLMVAKQLGRRYIGIELNPEYIKIAEDRIRKEGGHSVVYQDKTKKEDKKQPDSQTSEMSQLYIL